MTDLATLLDVQTEQLRQVDQQLSISVEKINEKALLEDPAFIKIFTNDFETDVDEENLSNLTITQLNDRYEKLQQDVHDLSRLKEVYTQVETIESLLEKSCDLLDFQQLFTLFKTIKVPTSTNLIIYKHIGKRIEQLNQQFVGQLDEYLRKFIPNEFTIINPHMLTDFNHLLLKNDIKLDYYNQLKLKWDSLVDKLSTSDLELSQVDYEQADLSLKPAKTSTSFINSVTNFIRFINLVDIESFKRFFNSKLSHCLILKISTNINDIVNDKQAISDLTELLDTSRPSGWNILPTFSNNTEFEANLNKLYVEYTVNVYIDKIRKLFVGDYLQNIEEIEVEIDQSPKPNQPGIHPIEAPIEPTIAPEVSKEDNWDQNWEENWEDNPEEPISTKNSEPQKPDTIQLAQEDESGWDDGWDNEWDIEDEEVSTKSPKEVPTASKTAVPAPSVALASTAKTFTVQISKLPDAFIEIINDFGELNEDLFNTFTALALSKYPDLSQSFLIFNDFRYLSKKLNSPKFDQFIDTQWNRVLVQRYLELKILVSSLNLSNEGVGTVDYELDDFNLNRVSSIYQWFVKIMSSSLNETNPKKYEDLLIGFIEFANNWFITTVLNLDEITEYQSAKITAIIESLNNVTVPIIIQLNHSKDSIKSYNKLQNVVSLVNNHLRDIMELFYQGELFAFETDELIAIIENIFVKSELRDNSINEIIEFRNTT